jgi:peptidoglycan/xylan/chitin deacetylase (PgdA/CDA1 family)
VGALRASFKDRECMTSAELRELASNGIEIGSHTITHPRLYELPWPEVEREVRDSKKMIEDSIGMGVESFCYPFAFPEMDRTFVGKFQALARESGYSSNVTTIIGTANKHTDRYSVPRLPVNTWDDDRLFQAKLAGAYNWLHAPQLAFKSLKRLVGYSRS